MSLDTNQETDSRIQAAAELLFAEHGYDGVTLRQITAAAKVNLAAVNYHYDDKQSLYLDILTHRMRQVSNVRLARLIEAESRLNGTLIPLLEIIDILAGPLLQPDESSMPSYGSAGRRLIGRALVEPLGFLSPVVATELQPAITRCGQAIRRHLPTLPPSDFIWRYSFLVGALHHTAATLHDMKSLTNGFCANNDGTNALHNFRHFASNAMTSSDFR